MEQAQMISGGNEKTIKQRRGHKRILALLMLCLIGVILNLTGGYVATKLKLPLFLDTIGTVLVASSCGYLPAALVGLASNLIKCIFDPASIYYGFLNVIMAVLATYLAQKGWMEKWYKAIGSAFVLSLVGGAFGSLFTWFLYGFATEGISATFAERIHETTNMPRFWAQMSADYLIDLPDKLITVAVVFVIRLCMPEETKRKLVYNGWQQTPLEKADEKKIRGLENRVMSLRTKILLLLIGAPLCVAIMSTTISYILYRQSTVEEHKILARGVANLAASVIDADKVQDYLKYGEEADGYLETKKLLYSIRESSPDIEYVYVYKIVKDGCYVVFDLDTEELEGEKPGTMVSFDESFQQYLPSLLMGKPIEPVISNDTYGWLLTVYVPVYDDHGICQCYAAADVSMERLRASSYTFFAKLTSLFLGFFIVIMVVGMWMAEYNVVLPVNSMAYAASAFAYNTEEAREAGVERIRKLDVHTGDEIENLYHAFSETTEESVQFVEDIEHQTETISKMQNGLIMVLADMVESRDQNTGDHVRKTAAYTKIIMDALKKKGYYEEQLTDEFIYDVYHSAPLHDVGKIKVRDAILNKPGKLDDEEFAEMKKHAMAGSEIISQAIEIVPESGYLNEAKNLAEYHHEKWNGKGYPHGIGKEEIPLSARIMAVADVFDALVSKRSYKKPFSFEQAMNIIREGAGEHFDPLIAEVFLESADEVRKVAEEFEKDNKDILSVLDKPVL